jgi:hypothetical protein
MSSVRSYLIAICLMLGLLAPAIPAHAQTAGNGRPVKSVEIQPVNPDIEVGQKIQFSISAKDDQGRSVNEKPTTWIAAPFDLAKADESGIVSFYQPGEVLIGAIVGGKPVFTTVVVKQAPVKTIEIDPPASPLIVGGTIKLKATARLANGDPRTDVLIAWVSKDPAIATVDAAGVAVGLAPGKTTLTASSNAAAGSVNVNVVKASISGLSVQPRTTTARTGDVIRFNAVTEGSSTSYAPRWSVSGEGATIDSEGGFVSELPGTYVITAAVGDKITSASVVVSPRNAERDIEVVGRVPLKDVEGAEVWIIGNYAYYSTIADRFFVYDISDPAKPKLTDTVKVDARIINDISTTADGKILVISREGASNRKNGIAFYDTTDPAHPKKISEYTETVTGGVHSAFVDGHYVYLTDDATGSMRVIDFADVKNPKEVARWQVENPIFNTVRTAEGDQVGGRYLHDLQVKDGLAYLAYWRDGLIILDVGNGIKGGSPEKPQLVSQLRFNHNELYGNGWLAGTHSVFRYKNYVFIGDEVFPPLPDIHAKKRFPVRGIVHVVDVSDINKPRKVAEYPVPEAGAHNMWVENDRMYMGYYNGGARIVDVSGDLRGDLYRQGREIGRLWMGDPTGVVPNVPFTWGAQPYKDYVIFNDINSGLWIVKVGNLIQKGSTTTPGR